MERITVGKRNFVILDEIENIPVVDSFVRTNKLLPDKEGSKPGHGEARLYIGSKIGETDFDAFFNHYNQQNKYFFCKADFEEFLDEAEYEYKYQEQKYYKNISNLWNENLGRISDLNESLIFFDINDANSEKDSMRYYIRSDNQIWTLMREIALPRISFLSILKLKDQSGVIYFYFRLFLDSNFNNSFHPAKIKIEEKRIIEDLTIPKTTKEALIKARIGQGKFRSKLLDNLGACVITGVTDKRLLIASHIKPWADSTDHERLDYLNGLTLTPTFDKMFDQGFISFDNKGVLLISKFISQLNLKRLNIAAGRKYELKVKGREKYLEFHRDKFKY